MNEIERPDEVERLGYLFEWMEYVARNHYDDERDAHWWIDLGGEG